MTRRLGVNFIAALCISALFGVVTGAAGSSPVADAAMRGDRDAVRTLLKTGADVSASQGDGMTALHWAAQRGDAELAAMLIYGGANVGAVTRIGQYTPLHLAAASTTGAVVEALIKAGANVSAKTTNTGATPLHMAASSGSAVAIKALVDAGADVNAKESEWGQTPLIFAASQNRVDAIKVLLERKADPNVASKTVDIAQASALDRAARNRASKVLETSVPIGQKATGSQIQGAIQAAREILLSGKIPPPDPNDNQGGRGGRDPNFNPEEINPPVAFKGGLTALHHAARQGYVASIVALVDGGANVNNVGGGEQASPLLTAIMNGQFDAAMALVERGADPNLAARSNGINPLWAAINTQWQPRTRFPQPQEMELQKSTYLDVVKALLEHGADPNVRIKSHPWVMVYTGCGNRNCGLADTSGSTPFWRAAYSVDVAAMKLLVAHGADPNIPTMAPREQIRRGGGPPPGAPGAGAPAAAAAPAAGQPGGTLVGRDVGAGGAVAPTPDANQERYSAPTIPFGGPGAFPLHAAAGVEYGEGFAGNAHRHAPGGWLPALKYLIEELGADVNARDNDGYTALHHAAARGDNEAILYLVSKGADVTAVARSGQTVADMANSPVQRLSPYTSTVALLEKLGSKNSHKCVIC
jgi:ankyrin repeat protein